MAKLIDLTLTLGSDRITPVPGLVGVAMEPLQTHDSHARFYSDGPYLSNEGADHLARCGVNAVALDFPIDKLPPTPQSTTHDFPVHRLLLGQNIPLIENLINLAWLVGCSFEIWALPLKLKGGDGAATRAVARII